MLAFYTMDLILDSFGVRHVGCLNANMHQIILLNNNPLQYYLESLVPKQLSVEPTKGGVCRPWNQTKGTQVFYQHGGIAITNEVVALRTAGISVDIAQG